MNIKVQALKKLKNLIKSNHTKIRQVGSEDYYNQFKCR